MQKVWTVLLILVIAAIDWAALHDILNGESDVRLEWSFIIVSVLLLAVFLARKLRKAN